MKIKLLTILLSFLLLSGIFHYSQAQNIPSYFNYQAVARNNLGEAISFKEIILEVSILKGENCIANKCNTIYQELHTPTTNEFGLFSVEIGSGQNTYNGTISNFKDIKWDDVTEANQYYLKVRVDFGNASMINGLIDMGTTKFQSVPYSIVSQSAEVANNIAMTNDKLPFTLSNLADVEINTLFGTQVLQYDGTKWINANVSAGSSALINLSDVSISFLAENQFLKYDVPTNSWKNSSITLNNISNFNIAASPSLNDIITWNGSSWTNQVNMSTLWKDGTNLIFYDGGKNVAIGTNTASDGIHGLLPAGKGVLFSGTYSGGLYHNLGAGSRMMFYPTNASFRAGAINGTQWDGAYIGNYSVAFGENNIASGEAAFAMGSTNSAKATNSTVFGTNNIAETAAVNSIIYGQNNTAFANSVLIIGKGNSGRGFNSIVIGENNNTDLAANGTHSLTSGIGNITESDYSCAIGGYNQPQGDYSTTLGYENQTIGSFSMYGFATGYQNDVQAPASNALGKGLQTLAYAMTVIGQYNSTFGASQTTWTINEPVFVIGNGTSSTVRNDAFIVYNNGNTYVSGTITADNVVKKVHADTKDYLKIENPLEIIKQIQGITWNEEKDNASKTMYGIEQTSLQKSMPELLYKIKDEYSADYISLIPVLIEAIKEQQKQIEDQQKQIEKLNNIIYSKD